MSVVCIHVAPRLVSLELPFLLGITLLERTAHFVGGTVGEWETFIDAMSIQAADKLTIFMPGKKHVSSSFHLCRQKELGRLLAQIQATGADIVKNIFKYLCTANLWLALATGCSGWLRWGGVPFPF